MNQNFEVRISDEIGDREVPDLRQSVGWKRRERDYPLLFERCLFWGSVRNELGKLIAFAYVTGPGLEHGYLEDVMVTPHLSRKGCWQ